MHAAVGPGRNDTAREDESEAASIGGPSRQGQSPRRCAWRTAGGRPRLLGSGLGALLWLALAVAPAQAARILHATVPTLLSGAGERDCRVYLPPSYATQAARERRYPVVVFLHGWPGAEGNWPGQGNAGETLDRLINAGRIPELIGLFPDGTGVGRLGRSMWMDSEDGRSKLETFLATDLVSWVDRTYRTQRGPAARAVIGLSDGATGGMNLIMRHPDVYGAVGAHSGVYRLTSDWSSQPLFGPEPRASLLRAANSPLARVVLDAAALRRAIVYFDCGDRDESLADNRALHGALDSLRIPHEFHIYPGSHDWGYWRTHLEQSLIAVTAHMRSAGASIDTLSQR